jgi:hypothetical protein
MKNYGNSFNNDSQSYNAGKVPIWLHTDEFYPAGCTLNNQTKGSTIPAGSVVYVAKMGGEATVLAADAAAPETGVTGLLLEDVYIGNVGATGTVVTKGQVLAKRIPSISAAVKALLPGITFVNE